MDNLSKSRENSAMNLVLRTVSGAAKLPNILFVHLHLKARTNSECGWNQFLLAVQLKSARHSLLVFHPHTCLIHVVWYAAVRDWWQEARCWQEPTCQYKTGGDGDRQHLGLGQTSHIHLFPAQPQSDPAELQQGFAAPQWHLGVDTVHAHIKTEKTTWHSWNEMLSLIREYKGSWEATSAICEA